MFLLSAVPEEEQDLKSFKASVFNKLWDEASDEKKIIMNWTSHF